MQLAWFEQQKWLEVRNTKASVYFVQGDTSHIQEPFFSHKCYRLFALDDCTGTIEIDGEKYTLDVSLCVNMHNSIVSAPFEGFIRIRVYHEREKLWRLVRCVQDDVSIDVNRYKKKKGWCYMQLQLRVGNAIGPNTILWIPPQKQNCFVVETRRKNGFPIIHLNHHEQGRFAFCWIRQPLLEQLSDEDSCTWVDELGADIDMSNVMVGDRFVLWSPLGWSISFQGEEFQELIFERRPAHFSEPWVRVVQPHRERYRNPYNACLLEGMNNMVQHSPYFSSWMAEYRYFSISSFLMEIDAGNLSGDLLWKMNHV